MRRFIAQVQATLDEAIGSSFVDHVTSGYRFLMRYYNPGDCVYIFGFSRGAYTARFLAEMVHMVGLLSDMLELGDGQTLPSDAYSQLVAALSQLVAANIDPNDARCCCCRSPR